MYIDVFHVTWLFLKLALENTLLRKIRFSMPAQCTVKKNRVYNSLSLLIFENIMHN